MENYSITKSFIETLPSDIKKKNKIFNEIKLFSDAFLNNDYDLLGDTTQHEIINNIHRFRINKSDRVHAIVENGKLKFFKYFPSSKHDISLKKITTGKDEEALNYIFSSEVILPEENLMEVVESNSFIYKLDEFQNEYSNYIYNRALIVKGTAGSGKTSIAIDFLRKYSITGTGNVAYFTYNNSLKEQVYKILFNNGYDLKNIHFFALNDNSIFNIFNLKYKDIFNDWYKNCQLPNKEKYKDILIHEIRNIIKGYAGTNFDNYDNDLQYLSEEEYINFKNKYCLEDNEKKEIYSLFKNYQKWLLNNSIYDENDLFYKIYKMNDSRYDYVIIDEVQDLTENELKTIISLVKNKNNVLISGDIHQSLNNYQFEFSRIITLFQKLQTNSNYIQEPKIITLNKNYRNSKNVIDYINYLRNLRTQYIGSFDLLSESEDIPYKNEDYEESILSICDYDILNGLNKDIDDTDAVYITFNKKDYNKLIEQVNSDRVIDIFDVKGLEYSNIVLYNPIENCLLENIECVKDNKKIRSKYRIGFNQYFTAITRAQNSIIICDNKEFDGNSIFNDKFINLNKSSTIDDTGFRIIDDIDEWNKIAISREKKCNYNDFNNLKIILDSYKKAKNYNKIKEIEVRLKFRDSDYNACAKELENLKLYDAAYEIYNRLEKYEDASRTLLYNEKFDKLNKYINDNNVDVSKIINDKYYDEIKSDINDLNNTILYMKEVLKNG